MPKQRGAGAVPQARKSSNARRGSGFSQPRHTTRLRTGRDEALDGTLDDLFEDEFEEEVDDELDERLAAGVLGRLVYLLLTMAVVAGAVFLLNSPAFRVRHVEVVGAHYLSSDAVVRAAQIEGQSPFALANRSVIQRVLALGVPEQATVFYQLPDTAVISVAERQPTFIWKVDTTLYLVADDGTILGTTASQTVPTVVVDVDRRPVSIGQKVDPVILRQAQTVLLVLPRIVSPAPSYLLHSKEFGLIIPTGVIPEIVLGDGNNLDAKLSVLRPVLQAALAARPVPKYVDLRVPSHPYYR